MVTKNIKIMKGQFLFLFLLLAVFGCKEDEFDTYSSVNYLSFYNNPATDSIVETFFFHQGKDAIEVSVKFNLGGQLLTEDCPIKLCVVDSLCRVVLQIEPSEFFEVGETVYSQAKIYFTSAISIPGWWDETVNKYYLGGFTPKKYEIFCREVGVTDLTGVEEKYIREYALKFKRYLEAHPEYEDDGTRITVTVIG